MITIGRLASRKLGLNSDYITTLTYVPENDANKTTGLVSSYQNGSDDAFSYDYDANGNITSISQGSVNVTYEYNSANELIQENNGFTNQTVTYSYDLFGNLTEKKVYAYTTVADPGTPTQTIPYVYGNSAWGDQLTSYNNQPVSYDAMGNPTSYLGSTLTWEGKQLTGVGTTTYAYDENGLRTQKTVSGTTTNYYYNGSVLMSLVQGGNTLLFSYDAQGRAAAVNFNGTYYYYIRNGQGDIVKLIDNNGNTVAEYAYDTWGKQLSCTGSLASTLGVLNPFRYRGYVYDEETQWYYLQSRYYNPEVGRFISADVLLSTGQGVIGHNTFAYCLGNPGKYIDSNGLDAIIITDPNAAGKFGHTSLLIQDADGNWYYFYYGPQIELLPFALYSVPYIEVTAVDTEDCIDENGRLNLSVLLSSNKFHPNRPNEDAALQYMESIYLVGDYSASYYEAVRIRDKEFFIPYTLLDRNCAKVSLMVLNCTMDPEMDLKGTIIPMDLHYALTNDGYIEHSMLYRLQAVLNHVLTSK